MRSFSFLVALLFAFVGFSAAFPDLMMLEARKGKNSTAGTNTKAHNGTAKNSIKKQCATMASLTALEKLASNTTKLNDLVAKGKLNQTEVDKIQAKASNATAKLQTLTSNTTLVAACEVVDAHEKLVSQCSEMKSLTKLSKLASNQTALDAMIAKKNLTGTKLQKFEAKIGNASAKLTKLQSNTTLATLCANEKKSNSTNDGSSATGTAATAQSTGAAATLALGPYLFVPLLSGAFALFL